MSALGRGHLVVDEGAGPTADAGSRDGDRQIRVSVASGGGSILPGSRA